MAASHDSGDDPLLGLVIMLILAGLKWVVSAVPNDNEATPFGQEFGDRVCQVGFEDVNLFGDLEGNECGVDASRLVAATQK